MSKHDAFYREALARGLPPHEAEIIADYHRNKACSRKRWEAYWASPAGQRQKRIEASKAHVEECIESYLHKHDYYWEDGEAAEKYREQMRRQLRDEIYEYMRDSIKIAEAAVVAGRATPDGNLFAMVKSSVKRRWPTRATGPRQGLPPPPGPQAQRRSLDERSSICQKT